MSRQWSPSQESLYVAMIQAHDESARRDNISHHVLKLAAIGSHDYTKSVSAALGSLGGVHAPLSKTYDLVTSGNCLNLARQLLGGGHKVPGWGNGFVKGEPDRIWGVVDRLIASQDHSLYANMESVTQLLHSKGKRIFPNPSCYTAVAGSILGLDRQTCAALFIQGRILAWADIFRETLHGT